MSQPLGRIVPLQIPAQALAVRPKMELNSAVLEFQSPTGALVASPPAAFARYTVWLIAAAVASCGAAMALIPIDKVVVSPGKLVSTAPELVVQPLETAIVRSIDVHEGEVVHAGQVLARLDPTFATADMGGSTEQVASLSAEVARLRAEIADLPYVPTEKSSATDLQMAIYAQRQSAKKYMLDNYQQKIDSLKATAQRAAADVQGYTQRLRIATELEAKRVQLEQLQVGSQINRLQATDNRLEMSRGLADAQGTMQGALRDLQAQIAQRDNYAQQWRADAAQTLSEQSRKLTDAQDQLTKASLRHQLVDLTAQQDAIVLNVAKVSVGSVLQSGDQFITLVPKNAPLEVEAKIAGGDAGYVGLGDHVTVKFDTFPYVRFGYAEGSVRTISDDSFPVDPTQQSDANGARRGITPISAPGGNVYYRVRVRLDDIKLRNTPQGFHLTPGMPITADIKVGKRTMLSYLFSRVLPTINDGMREP